MSELSHDVRQAAKELTENSDETMHYFRRKAIIDLDGHNVSLSQSKDIYDDESASALKRVGARTFASAEWFNDITFHDGQDNQSYDTFDPKALWLNALYPLDYFPVPPQSGHFSEYRGERRWHDSYNDKTGNGEKSWYTFVNPENGEIETVETNDPAGVQHHNDIFKYYLRRLDENGIVEHAQTREFDTTRRKHVGGKALYATMIKETLDTVEPLVSTDSFGERDAISVWLQAKRRQYRIHTHEDDAASVEIVDLSTIKDHVEEPASDQLLQETLDLLNRAAS